MSSQNVSRNGSRPKLLMALPKNIGETSPARKRSRSKRVAGGVEQLDLLAELRSSPSSSMRLEDHGIVEPDELALGHLGADGGARPGARRVEEVHALATSGGRRRRRRRSRKMGQVIGYDADAEHVLDLADEIERLAPGPVHLVDEA